MLSLARNVRSIRIILVFGFLYCILTQKHKSFHMYFVEFL